MFLTVTIYYMLTQTMQKKLAFPAKNWKPGSCICPSILKWKRASKITPHNNTSCKYFSWYRVLRTSHRNYTMADVSVAVTVNAFWECRILARGITCSPQRECNMGISAGTLAEPWQYLGFVEMQFKCLVRQSNHNMFTCLWKGHLYSKH